jgi:zinc protease
MRDILANDRFDREELQRWKKQAQLEWKAGEKDVEFRGRQLVARGLYRPGDPRLRQVEEPRRVETDTGELKSVRDRIVRLPGRAIGLAGDLTREEAERAVASLLPPASASPAVDAAPALLPLRERAERQDSEARIRRLTQVYFALGRESVTYDDPRYPAFVLANHVLGGHFYSRIMVALRHEGGETYGAFAAAETDIDPGPFLVGSFTRTENAAHAEEKLRDALRTFHADGLTEEERAEAAGYLTGNAPFSRQTPFQILSRAMTERRLGLEPGFFDGLSARAAALSLDEVNAFVRDYYGIEAFVMGRVAPAK